MTYAIRHIKATKFIWVVAMLLVLSSCESAEANEIKETIEPAVIENTGELPEESNIDTNAILNQITQLEFLLGDDADSKMIKQEIQQLKDSIGYATRSSQPSSSYGNDGQIATH